MGASINISHTLCYTVKRIIICYICYVEPVVIQEILEKRNKCEVGWETAAEGTTGEIRKSGSGVKAEPRLKHLWAQKRKLSLMFCPLLVETSNSNQDNVLQATTN